MWKDCNVNLNILNILMKKETIGIIGLGYVGLPLACLFALKHKVIGFDLDGRRVNGILQGADSTGEVPDARIRMALDAGMECTANKGRLKDCHVFIIAVQTPVDRYRNPELSPLEEASLTVGGALSPGDIVIYESTVYPGVTEEFCVPVLEKASGLCFNKDFFVGYSPERINPGDKTHTVEDICKITSGSTPEVAEYIDGLYRSVLKNGTYRAASIKVAEAAKVIENVQRDVNVALMNETARIFHALGIDTQEVLRAAGTKWNFLPFAPGLVGGHCISVDPYYLIRRAETSGICPRLMREARRINDTMGNYVAARAVESMIRNGITVKDASVLLLGFAYKKDCSDIRSTRVADIYRDLRKFTSDISVYDPIVDARKAMAEYGIKVCTDKREMEGKKYAAIICCVGHSCFGSLDIRTIRQPGGIVYDVGENLPEEYVTDHL